jgi:hypothetical protein
MLGLNRAVWPEDGPVVGPDAKIDGSNINAYSLEDFNHLGLKDDAATSAVEIVGGALEVVDIPVDLAQQIAGEEPAERPTNDQRPAPI